jgi:hypothetical protein
VLRQQAAAHAPDGLAVLGDDLLEGLSHIRSTGGRAQM